MPFGAVPAIHRAAAATSMPWRNGGGTTRELARSPATGEFDWRLSVAEVGVDGPFSAFVGYERVIWLLSGAGMDLDFGEGEIVRLRTRWQAHRFAGERDVMATLSGGPTTDLNLMWRRTRFEVDTMGIHVAGPCAIGDEAGSHVAFVATGTLVLADGVTLGPGDAATWAGVQRCSGDATVLGHHLVPLGR